MNERAKRLQQIEPTDREAARAALYEALRADDIPAAFEAFKGWSGMQVPGKSRCEALETLRRVLVDYGAVVKRLDGRPVHAERSEPALDLLAWWWEHAVDLQGPAPRKGTRYILVDADAVDRAMVARNPAYIDRSIRDIVASSPRWMSDGAPESPP